MPGYKLTPNEDYARLESLLCPWCGLILRAALQTESGIRLCETCYKEIQSSPDHTCPRTGKELVLEPNEPYHPDNAVRKEVNRLVVKCANHEQGCAWVGHLKQHEDEHSAACEYKTVQCRNSGCESLVLISEHMDHEVNTCPFRSLDCQYCGIGLLAKDYQLHVVSCPCAPEKCDNCGDTLERDELKEHQSLLCPVQLICTVCRSGVSTKEQSDVDNTSTHLKSPVKVFEHFQQLGIKVYHVDKSKRELEQAMSEVRQSLSDDGDKIRGLQDSLQDVRKMKEVFTTFQALAGDEGIHFLLNKLERRMSDMESKAEKQDQIIANLRGSSISGAGSSQHYSPSNLSSNMEEYPAGDRLSQLERKVEEVERQTAMLKVHMSELELQLQASLASTYNGSFLWRIPEVKKRKRDAMDGRITSIYSPPFYTGRNGYKMCIRAYLNGDGIGYNTHLSIFFVLMKGEYDPLLKWPFDYKVSLIMVDQEHRRHIVQTFKPSPSSGSFQQPKTDMNIASGCPKFADLKVLENDNYVKEDVLYIKCIVDVARIFHP